MPKAKQKLRNLKVKEVSFVPSGDNPPARVLLFKAKPDPAPPTRRERIRKAFLELLRKARGGSSSSALEQEAARMAEAADQGADAEAGKGPGEPEIELRPDAPMDERLAALQARVAGIEEGLPPEQRVAALEARLTALADADAPDPDDPAVDPDDSDPEELDPDDPAAEPDGGPDENPKTTPAADGVPDGGKPGDSKDDDDAADAPPFAASGAGDNPPDDDEEKEPMKKFADVMAALSEADRAVVKAEIDARDAQILKLKPADPADPYAGLPDSIKKQLQDRDAEHAEMKKDLAKANRERGVAALAKQLMVKALPTKADDLAELLYEIPVEKRDQLVALIKAADEAVQRAGMLSQLGSDREGGARAGSAEATLQERVKEMRKADPRLTEASARVAAMKADPELYRQLQAEDAERVANAPRTH